jgi:hypothetical protein
MPEGKKKKKLPALDPTRDPQKPGPPTTPRDARTPPPSTLPDTPPTKGSVPASGRGATREPDGRADPDDKGRRDEDGL